MPMIGRRFTPGLHRAAWGFMQSGDFPVPVLHLKFGKNTGAVAYDSSPKGIDGTIEGATWTKGWLGPALSFDGEDDYVDLDNVPFASIFTCLFRCYVNPNDARQVILAQLGSGEQDKFSLSIEVHSLNKFRFITTTDGTTATLVNIYGDDVLTEGWYEVGLWSDGSEIRLYINLVKQTTVNATVVYNSAAPIALGRYRGHNIRYYLGLLDELIWFDVALSLAQMRQVSYGYR